MDLDQLLRDAGPRVTVDQGASVALGELARNVTSRDRPVTAAKPRRRRRIGIALAASALACTGTGVAAAGVLGAHTGLFGSPGKTENDTSEWIDTSAPDFPAVAAQIAPADLALPPGVSMANATDQVVRQSQRAPGLRQVTGLQSAFVFYAQCQWKRSWLDGQASTSAASIALTNLVEQPSFIAVDGGGLREDQLASVAAIRAGDRASVRADFRDWCSGGFGSAPVAGDSGSDR